ncbi:MAG: DsrE family protein [Anditalea sp.]
MIQQLIILFFAMAIQTNHNPGATTSKVMDEQEHKVIMQVTQADSTQQLVVVGQIRNILKALPNAQIEVVCHSQGLGLLVASQSKAAKHVKELMEHGVVFAACENTMERKKITKKDLLPGVTTVPSGMAELVLKQEMGWIYVKAGL